MKKRKFEESPIVFSNPGRENGWLSLWSPHSLKFREHSWINCIHAWYGTRYQQEPTTIKPGIWAIQEYKQFEETEENISDILEKILWEKVKQHPILAQYLRNSNSAKIIYRVSQYSDSELKWLGETETGSGDNYLGQLWMKIRSCLQNEELYNHVRNDPREARRKTS